MNNKLLTFIFLLLAATANAQTAFPVAGEVFRDDVIPRIDIILPQDSLDVMLAPDESTPSKGKTILCRHPTISRERANVTPSRVETLLFLVFCYTAD